LIKNVLIYGYFIFDVDLNMFLIKIKRCPLKYYQKN
jgi:hypothetical protein